MKLKIEDFVLHKMLGKGSFGKVWHRAMGREPRAGGPQCGPTLCRRQGCRSGRAREPGAPGTSSLRLLGTVAPSHFASKAPVPRACALGGVFGHAAGGAASVGSELTWLFARLAFFGCRCFAFVSNSERLLLLRDSLSLPNGLGHL